MDNKYYQEYLQNELKTKFRGSHSIKSKVAPRYPESAEREFQRLSRQYLRIFKDTLKDHLPAIMEAYKKERHGSTRLDDSQDLKAKRTAVAPYENPSHFWDDHGRPPHSIEIVVDGGDSVEIAQQILSEKAGGINTFGNTAVVVKGKYDEDITIRFNRPDVIYVWYRLGIVLSKTQADTAKLCRSASQRCA